MREGGRGSRERVREREKGGESRVCCGVCGCVQEGPRERERGREGER